MAILFSLIPVFRIWWDATKPRLKDPRRVEHLSPIGIYCNRRSERAPDLGAVSEGENNLVTIEEFGTARICHHPMVSRVLSMRFDRRIRSRRKANLANNRNRSGGTRQFMPLGANFAHN
jgi:hypothetical protein